MLHFSDKKGAKKTLNEGEQSAGRRFADVTKGHGPPAPPTDALAAAPVLIVEESATSPRRFASNCKRAAILLPREFTLLEYLMRRPGPVVTRAMLLEDV
jgi:DNA-binding response OmpR family regulator